MLKKKLKFYSHRLTFLALFSVAQIDTKKLNFSNIISDR